MATNVQLPTLKADETYQIAAPYVFIGDPTVSDGDGMLEIGQVPSASISMNPSKQMASDVAGHQQAAATFDRGVNPEITLTLADVQARVTTALMSAAVIPEHEESITGVDDGAGTFTVGGDVSGLLATGEIITVTGSTGNDGDYTVDSVSYDSNNDETTITVQESVPDATADGKIIGFIEGQLFQSGIQKIDPPSLIIVPKGKEEHAIERAGVYHIPAVVDTGIGDFMWEDADGEDANNEVDFTMTALQREQDQDGVDYADGAQVIHTVPPGRLPNGHSHDLPGDFGQSP
jgi:hypothetical protein